MNRSNGRSRTRIIIQIVIGLVLATQPYFWVSGMISGEVETNWQTVALTLIFVVGGLLIVTDAIWPLHRRREPANNELST